MNKYIILSLIGLSFLLQSCSTFLMAGNLGYEPPQQTPSLLSPKAGPHFHASISGSRFGGYKLDDSAFSGQASVGVWAQNDLSGEGAVSMIGGIAGGAYWTKTMLFSDHWSEKSLVRPILPGSFESYGGNANAYWGLGWRTSDSTLVNCYFSGLFATESGSYPDARKQLDGLSYVRNASRSDYYGAWGFGGDVMILVDKSLCGGLQFQYNNYLAEGLPGNGLPNWRFGPFFDTGPLRLQMAYIWNGPLLVTLNQGILLTLALRN